MENKATLTDNGKTIIDLMKENDALRGEVDVHIDEKSREVFKTLQAEVKRLREELLTQKNMAQHNLRILRKSEARVKELEEALKAMKAVPNAVMGAYHGTPDECYMDSFTAYRIEGLQSEILGQALKENE